MAETQTPAFNSVSKPEVSAIKPSLIDVDEGDITINKGVIAVIPAYNEQIALGSVVLLVKKYVDRVIVVDDGSIDRTSEVATAAGAEVIRLDDNMGKAYALLLGLKRARELGCKAAVMLDADGQHLTRDIPRLAAPVLSGDADLVIGSRFIGTNGNIPMYRKAGQKTLNLFTRVGSQQDVTDSQSGYRALSRNALNFLDFKSDGYNVESDMIAHFGRNGLIIREMPIDVRYDVPNKHKKNPVTHGMGVLTQLINLISYRRPLLAFGLPGGILIVGGMLTEMWVFTELRVNNVFHDILAAGSAFVLVLGMLLVIAGLILNTLVRIINECKH
jgi:glycosyltransferase involved in cell wall biosynthesis